VHGTHHTAVFGLCFARPRGVGGQAHIARGPTRRTLGAIPSRRARHNPPMRAGQLCAVLNTPTPWIRCLGHRHAQGRRESVRTRAGWSRAFRGGGSREASDFAGARASARVFRGRPGCVGPCFMDGAANSVRPGTDAGQRIGRPVRTAVTFGRSTECAQLVRPLRSSKS
jgi:hypothetical protein